MVSTQCVNNNHESGLRQALYWIPSCPLAKALHLVSIFFSFWWRASFAIFLSLWFCFLWAKPYQNVGVSNPLTATHAFPMTTKCLLRFEIWLNVYGAFSLWSSQLLSLVGPRIEPIYGWIRLLFGWRQEEWWSKHCVESWCLVALCICSSTSFHLRGIVRHLFRALDWDWICIALRLRNLSFTLSLRGPFNLSLAILDWAYTLPWMANFGSRGILHFLGNSM